MPYAQFQSQLSGQNQSFHIGLIDNYLSTPSNIDELSGTELSKLIDTALKANTAEGIALFLKHDALHEKYETDAVKTLFLADPATFASTQMPKPLPEHVVNKLKAELKKAPDTFLANIDHLCKLSVVKGDEGYKVYSISLDDVLETLLTKYKLTVTKDDKYGDRPRYEEIDNDIFFKELFSHIFKENSHVIDDFLNQFSGKHFQTNSFLFRRGHLLTDSQSQILLTHDKVPALLKRGLETHGYAFDIARWPDASLNLIRDKLLALPSEGDEDKALKLKWLKNLAEYTGNFREDEGKWYKDNIVILLNAIHALIPAHKEYENIQRLFDTYFTRKPALVQAVLDNKEKWLSVLTATPLEESNLKLGKAPYCYVLVLLKNADQAQFQALFELEAVKAFCAVPENNLLDILKQRPECKKGTDEERAEALEALLDLEEVSQHLSGDDIQNTNLTDIELAAILSKDELRAKFHCSKEHRLVEAIFDKKWDTMGRGFFARKTPTNIAAMRHVLGGKLSTITYPLASGLYDKLVGMADDASRQSSCLWNTRDKTVQAFYSLIGDDKEDKPLTFKA